MKKETISHSSHPFGADQPARLFPARQGPNLARDASRGRAVHDVHVHSGMTDRQANAMNAGGMSHATASGGQVGNVLAKPPLPKTFRPVPSSSDGYSPNDLAAHELGVRMIEEANSNHPNFRGKSPGRVKSKC
jgi:hypothetical protein